MESVDTYSAKVDYIPVRVLDKQYYLANFKVSKRAEPTTEDEKLLFARNNSFIMILDQSGSMAGGPWTALVEGGKQVATRIYELNEFNNFATFFFSDKCTEMKSVSLNDFTSKIHKLSPNNSTNFVSTFTKICEYTENINPTDITVLFLTDGLDTCNGTDAVQTSLNQMKEFLRSKEIVSRFYTIGLSSSHDSVLLSKIAQAGSDLGNFFYVDYNENNGTRTYKDTIKECLVQTFDLGTPSNSMNIEVNYGNISKRLILPPIANLEEGKEGENEEFTSYEVSNILDSLPEGEMEIKIIGEEHSLFIIPTEEGNVVDSITIKAECAVINQLMFDFIQKVINSKSLDVAESKQIYENLEKLNSRVSELIEQGFKIKNKMNRKAIIQSCQDFKDKLSVVISILRDVVVNKNTMDLTKVAKLNDLAYKAIRSKGLKRKLDERALKNEEHYKKLDAQIKEKVGKFDYEKIASENQDIINTIGDCPLTCLNALEAIKEGDCLGICLDVARSEAAIADPSQLIVRDVIPTFMSCSAYMDSAAFNLERESTAHGEFDTKSQGNLAMGLGRENVTGILPLYLFNEHWEIAKRTIPSIFGFMCTLDIMGYSDDQYFIIPFTVLYRCLEKVNESPTDMNKTILSLVKQTCVEIAKRHEVFASRVVEKLKNFEIAPINRTKDVIPNFKVFLAQVLCCIEVGAIKKEDFDWMKIIRFLVEEKCRRLAQKEDDIPSKRAQSDYFNGNKTEKIVSKAMEIKNLSENQKFTVEEILEKLNGEKQIDNSEELKQVEALVDDEVESQPWYNSLSNGDSKATQNLHSFNNSLGKSLNFIKVFILNLNSDAVPTPESMKDLDCFKEDIVCYAMLFQNSLHPANKMRREAIEANQYVEITDKEIAEKYLKDTYRSLLNLEISGEESRILTLQNSDMYSNISQTCLLIKDIPAFVNLIKGLKVGDGGVSNLLKSMIDNVSLNAIEKLRCIATMNFNGNTIFADEYKVRPSKLKIKSARLFNLYINYVYKAKQATDDQFKDVFQEITDEKIQKWIVTYKNILSKQGENN